MMRRLIISALLLASVAVEAMAVPATPNPIRYRQPDGSFITVRMHGDEFYHYATSEGKVVAPGRDGFWRSAEKPSPAKAEQLRRRARRSHQGPRKVARANSSISLGDKHFLVMLVEFKDLTFSVDDPAGAFSRMLNAVGYSENGGTGSVADYFRDNSCGSFNPVFDVVGPLQVSGTFADYGANNDDGSDKNVDGMVVEACRLADPMVNFKDYDIDADGFVDNVFIYYAGHNEAEGASADHIWPHASVVYEKDLVLDGVRPWSYACSSELRGLNGSAMTGIGTFCHEFSHVLGLPDFYDTDYEENGTANCVYAFSLMCDGPYNNNGRTPPYMGALERWKLGWIDEIRELSGSGSVSLRPVYENDCCQTPTSVDGEFFLYEVRDGSGWDSYIKSSGKAEVPSGMLVYHVDMSKDNIVGSGPAANLWETNSLNCYGSHPCYYIVWPSMLYRSYQDLVFPGGTGTTSFEGVDWAGLESGYKLSDIAYDSGTVSFKLGTFMYRNLSGKVMDSKGRALQGVTVSVTSRSVLAAIQTVTDAGGAYSIDIPLDAGLDVTVEFSLEMYTTRTETLQLSKARSTVLDVTLYDYSEGVPSTLQKYAYPSVSLGFTDDAQTSWSSTNAVLFSAEDLLPYKGYKFTKINYMIAGSSAEVVDVFIDFGPKRVLTRTVKPEFNKVQSVDVSDAGIFVPENIPVYIGYSVKDITDQYWMTIDGEDAVEGGGLIRMGYQIAGGDDWYDVGYNFVISAGIVSSVSPFSSLGIKVISNPGNGKPYTAGTVFNLAFDNPAAGGTAVSTVWYFDGNVTEETSVVLTAGTHTIKAVVTYADGSVEEIEQVILVN